MGIGQHQLERGRNPLMGDAAADIQKIGRRTAVEAQAIHGGHGQSGAIGQAADRTLEAHIVQPMPLRLAFDLVLLVMLAQRQDLRVAEERGVVDRHGNADRDHPPALMGQ